MMRGGGGTATEEGHEGLLEQLVESLMQSAEHPPAEVQGVSDEFIEQLERVPKKNLKADQTCPICSNPFLEGTHHCYISDLRGYSMTDTSHQTLTRLLYVCHAIRTTCSTSSAYSLG